jgi:dipeptidyl aminopeptidase/acylaminoacyl peptidase
MLIPRRLLFADPERSAARISDDGALIAFRAPLNGEPCLWVAPLRRIDDARPYSPATGGRAPAPVWLYNNRCVIFFRDHDGDENWQAHRVELQTGDVLALTPPGVHCSVEQISRDFPDEVLIAHNQRDPEYFDLYRINALTGESVLVERNDGFAEFVTDSQFRVRLAMRWTDEGGKEFLQRDGNRSWQPFARVGMVDAMLTQPVAFSAEGGQLYWLDSRGRDKAALVAQDIALGATLLLAEDDRADIREMVLDPSMRHPIAAAATFTHKCWHAIDPNYAADVVRVAAARSGELSIIGLSGDRGNWLVSFEEDIAPEQFMHYDRGAAQASLLFSSRPDLERFPLVRMEPVVVHARDGLELVCYLSRPRGTTARKPGPMVLSVHGGPWSRDVWEFSPMHQWLANRGYAVLSVNFRGSIGFGKKFVNAADREWGGKMQADLVDSVDWAILHGIADPDRIAVLGASYGGYAALVGITSTPEKFRCAVDIVGMSDLLTWVRTFPAYWRSYHNMVRTRVGDFLTEPGRRLLQERSPLNRVDRIVRPLLIAQGGKDPRVKPSESEQMVQALRQCGVPVTYLYYPDEGHGLRRPENRRSLIAVVEAFLAKHLGGAFEPISDDFVNSSIEFRAGRELIPLVG